MKRKPVSSSNVVSVGHSGEVLEVEYQGGLVYTYVGVSAKVYHDLMASASVGSYIAENVKGKYPFHKGEQTIIPASE